MYFNKHVVCTTFEVSLPTAMIYGWVRMCMPTYVHITLILIINDHIIRIVRATTHVYMFSNDFIAILWSTLNSNISQNKQQLSISNYLYSL